MDFKLRCIKTKNSPITPGAKAYKDKVYIFEDGRTTWENGIESLRYDSAEDFFEHNINLGVHFEEVKELKELTFKEVIANIKEGEVWENKELELKITFKKNEFYIGDSNDNEINGYVGQFINNGLMFKLQRKEYTFEEAFKALEEGKEIESITQYRYKKAGDGYKFYSKDIGEWWKCSSCLSFEELKGKWYINEVN